MHEIILASSSKYRRELLQRLQLPFLCASPDIDESQKSGEKTKQTAERLAQEKAEAIGVSHKSKLIIASDQVADLNGQLIGKPGTHEKACAQLQQMSGQLVLFHTAVFLLLPEKNLHDAFCVTTQVRFRTLTSDEIERYVAFEKPLDCAGSAKSEGLGISLLDSMESDDPTALIGLPLIELSKAMRKFGFIIP